MPPRSAQLKVSEDVVETFGAVSVATAWAMARGALAASDADVAVAITGIAGPGGGTAQKPVGTVVFARAERDADPAKIVADQKFFDETTALGVRLQAALCALELLDAVKRRGALLERAVIRLSARSNIGPASVSNSRDLKAKSTEKSTFGAAVGRAVELPLVVQIFERPFDIVDADPRRPLLHDAAGEALLEGVEADDEVGDRLRLARRADPHRDHPGQEFVVALRRPRRGRTVARAYREDAASRYAAASAAFARASCASRAACIFLKSSPA